MRISSIYALFSFASVQLFAFIIGLLFVVRGFSVVDDPSDVGNSVFFFVYIIVAAVVMLLVLKYYKGKNLFFFLELFLLFLSTSILFLLFVQEEIALAIGAVFAAVRFLRPSTKNIFLLFVSAIIGALLGASLDLIPAAILALLLSLYDFAAVFLTKHMVKLAEELRGRNAAFSVSFPFKPAEKNVIQKIRKEKGSKVLQQVQKSFDTIELGTGDLVIPGMILVSALKVSAGHGFAAFIGGFAGMALLFYFIDRKKGYWPALPPIVFCSLGAVTIYSIAVSFIKF